MTFSFFSAEGWPALFVALVRLLTSTWRHHKRCPLDTPQHLAAAPLTCVSFVLCTTEPLFCGLESHSCAAVAHFRREVDDRPHGLPGDQLGRTRIPHDETRIARCDSRATRRGTSYRAQMPHHVVVRIENADFRDINGSQAFWRLAPRSRFSGLKAD